MLSASPGFASSTNNQEGDLNTNTVDSTVSSNNSTIDRSVSKTYNGAGSSSEMPVASSISPSYMSNGIETCLQGFGASIQTGMVGLSRGRYVEDEECNRRRDAKTLSDLGMKVAAIARMCESDEVWRSMFMSGTPCPLQRQGKLVVGKRAFLLMKRNPELYIPEYGEVQMVRSALIAKTPATPKYTETQIWYNEMLGIGVDGDEETAGDFESVSSRFRSSLR